MTKKIIKLGIQISNWNDVGSEVATVDPDLATIINSVLIFKNTDYLNSTTIQKMILRLLKDAKMTRSKLAGYLNTTTLGLRKLSENRASLELIERVSLPLINRYCLTEFIDH